MRPIALVGRLGAIAVAALMLMPLVAAAVDRNRVRESGDPRPAGPGPRAKRADGRHRPPPPPTVLRYASAVDRLRSTPRAQRGYTYLLLLLFVLIAGGALAAVATVWKTFSLREKEVELLFVGDEFRRAIKSYYDRSPVGAAAAKQYPRTLDDLLQDQRFPNVQRHLRKIYVDPMTGNADWGMVKVGDRIVGVYSLSTERPIKSAGFSVGDASFADAKAYSDWKFTAAVQARRAAGPPGSGGAAPAGLLQSAAPMPLPHPGPPPREDDSAQPAVPLPNPSEPMCRSQRQQEFALCGQPAEVAPDQASQCNISVTVRYQACLNGTALPPLRTGR